MSCPERLGGTQTVPLCEKCHSKVNDRSMVGHRELIRKGLIEARAKGIKLGQPKKLTPAKAFEIQGLHACGLSMKEIAALTNVSVGTVHKAVHQDVR